MCAGPVVSVSFTFRPDDPVRLVEEILDGTDVTATSHRFEAYAGVSRAYDWNHSPEPGARASPYCRCGRAKSDQLNTCFIHRKRDS